MGGRHKSWALVVEDEPWQAKALCRILSPRFRVRLASTQREALAALGQTTPLRLVLTALSLGGAGARRACSGLDVLDAAANDHPHAPRAAMATCVDPGIARDVQSRGAVLLPKPVAEDALRSLLDRAAAYPIRSPALARHVVSVMRAQRLTRTEGAILCWLVQGRSREDFCAEHAMKPATFDWHVDELRKKFAGRPRVHELVISILRELVERTPPPDACIVHPKSPLWRGDRVD